MATTAAARSTTTLWSKIKKTPIQHPLLFGIVLSTFKTSLSDLLVQTVIEKKEKIDWKRNAAFASFGCFYLGGVQYAIYVNGFQRLFPSAASFAAKSVREKLKDPKGIRNLFGQVFLDQAIHHPLMYFPAFYITKEVVMSDKPDIMKVLSEYRSNMSEDVWALWKVWVPSTFINFAFMPMHLRIPWVAGTSLIWTCILSAMRGGDIGRSDDVAMGQISGASMKIMTERISDIWCGPVELDKDLCHLCVSCNGAHKIGWVALLARIVSENGGNVTHSKMIHLGTDFTVLMHVSAQPEQAEKLKKAILSNKELSTLQPRVSGLTRYEKQPPPTLGFRIHCVGEDRPGILAAIASELSKKRLSVENITTELRLNTATQKREFVINADCITRVQMDDDRRQDFVNDLIKVKNELNLDVMDILVHTGTQR